MSAPGERGRARGGRRQRARRGVAKQPRQARLARGARLGVLVRAAQSAASGARASEPARALESGARAARCHAPPPRRHLARDELVEEVPQQRTRLRSDHRSRDPPRRTPPRRLSPTSAHGSEGHTASVRRWVACLAVDADGVDDMHCGLARSVGGVGSVARERGVATMDTSEAADAMRKWRREPWRASSRELRERDEEGAQTCPESRSRAGGS